MHISIIALAVVGITTTSVLFLDILTPQKDQPAGSAILFFKYNGDPIGKDTDNWLALHNTKNSWRLSTAKIDKKYSHGDDPDVPEVEIKSSIPNTRMLLKAKKLKTGRVVIVGGGDFLTPGSFTACTSQPGCIEKLKLDSRQYQLKTIHLPNDKKKLETRVRLLLYLDDKKQSKQILINEYTNYTVDLNWHLELAGDLDGDGKLDLIIRTQEGESGKDMLFLSSHAKKNELVGLAGLTEW